MDDPAAGHLSSPFGCSGVKPSEILTSAALEERKLGRFEALWGEKLNHGNKLQSCLVSKEAASEQALETKRRFLFWLKNTMSLSLKRLLGRWWTDAGTSLVTLVEVERTKYFLTWPFRSARGCDAWSCECWGTDPTPDLTFKPNLPYRLYSSRDEVAEPPD